MKKQIAFSVVASFPFNVESQALISSIRITPILCTENAAGKLEPIRFPSESQWEAIREILRGDDSVYKIARHAGIF